MLNIYVFTLTNLPPKETILRKSNYHCLNGYECSPLTHTHTNAPSSLLLFSHQQRSADCDSTETVGGDDLTVLIGGACQTNAKNTRRKKGQRGRDECICQLHNKITNCISNMHWHMQRGAASHTRWDAGALTDRPEKVRLCVSVCVCVRLWTCPAGLVHWMD